ncbi:MAG: hypothetical protein EOP06_17520, partial [Proteobacteria bacterium]
MHLASRLKSTSPIGGAPSPPKKTSKPVKYGAFSFPFCFRPYFCPEGDLSFGPRGQSQSLLNANGEYNEDGNSFNIQNLYASYAFTDKFSMTAGFMGTFIGYEVISPAANFHYSTSYLFSYGPFQNAGIRANYTFSEKVGVMVGLFNDSWNVYTANPAFGVNAFGAQISVSPVEGWTAYANVLTGSECGTIFDLTTSYDITEKFALGLNAADFDDSGSGYSGVALYPKYSISDNIGLGLRGEYFKVKESGPEITALTLSANLKHGGLTFIPEVRLDNAD